MTPKNTMITRIKSIGENIIVPLELLKISTSVDQILHSSLDRYDTKKHKEAIRNKPIANRSQLKQSFDKVLDICGLVPSYALKRHDH